MAGSNTPSSCIRCGQTLVNGWCPACDEFMAGTFVRREFIVLLVLSAIVVVGFLATRAVANANSALRLRDAAAWFDMGTQALAEGRSDSAVRALRRAVAIDRDQKRYSLALASALVANQEDDAARQVLLGIRQFTPEDPEVNLLLARLEARHGDIDVAVSHYQNALYGSWVADQQSERRQARVEFIRYLLANDQRGRALSELLILSGNLPDDVASQTEAAQLLLDAGDPSRALDQFRRVLRLEPSNGPALAGAGRSTFALGEYTNARRYLISAAANGGDASFAGLKELRELTDLVLTRDPLAARLPIRERRERLKSALQRASERLETCIADVADASSSTPADLEALQTEAQTLEAALGARRPDSSSDSIETGLNLVYRMEQRAQSCSPETPADRALLLIGQRHDVDKQ